MPALKSREFRHSAVAIATMTLVLALGPLVLGSYGLHVMTIAFYYVILAASWNLLAGYTGQFSLAHHAFAAVGAYTSGLLGHHWGISFWIGIPAGVTLSAMLGWGLGRLVLRMRAISTRSFSDLAADDAGTTATIGTTPTKPTGVKLLIASYGIDLNRIGFAASAVVASTSV